MRRIRLPEERLIIDDCYNANPQAMAAALTILADTDCRRRVAVMGDMGELGRLSSDAHREAGALAARLGLDQVIAIGEKARLMAQGAGNIALHFDTVEQAMPGRPGGADPRYGHAGEGVPRYGIPPHRGGPYSGSIVYI